MRDLVAPLERPKRVIGHFWDRANVGVEDGRRRGGSQVHSIAEVLRQIGKFHCRLPSPDIQALTRWAARVAPDPTNGMTLRNRTRLLALLEPDKNAMVLHLPVVLMSEAQRPDTPLARAVLLATQAAAVELLTVCPMRLSNLRELHLVEHLQRADPASTMITRIFVPELEIKNSNRLDWPLPTETGRLLRTYITKFRSRVAAPDNPFLFAGHGIAPRSVNAMREAIVQPILERVGVAVHPHLFRHFAAHCFLRRHPGQYEMVRRILGHKSVETTIAFYSGLEAEAAAERFDRVVLDERRATRLAAMAGFQNTPSRGTGASRRCSG